MFSFLILSIFSACSPNENDMEQSPLYDGKKLTIGVVGNAPKVREQNITFKKITLNEIIEEHLSSKYNAVFIMKEHLSEASKAPFAKIYKNSGIPFFFIESKKSYIPFVDEKTNYEEFPDIESGVYAYGYYQSGETGQYWGYGLYNDTVNEKNISDVYSRIFKTIETIYE